MRLACSVALLTLLAGCAEGYLDQYEGQVSGATEPSAAGSLAYESKVAFLFSQQYVEAARATARTQDTLSAVVFISAASTVAGLVSSTSDVALANRAIVGAGAQTYGTLATPQKSIEALYIGARRMNCISAVAAVGENILTDDPTLKAARAFTSGAIQEVRIKTREGLVRQIADFDTLVEAITPPDSVVKEGALETDNSRNFDSLNYYTEILSNCLKADPSLENATD